MALRALDRVRNRLSRPTDAARVARINHRWAFYRGTGSAIPREPRADENGVPDRLRSGDLLHERQAC
jgi:hypothetical protein